MRMPSVIEGIRYVSEGYPLSLMRFQVVNDRDGSFRWVFYNQFGTPAMHSDHSFRSEAEAVAPSQRHRKQSRSHRSRGRDAKAAIRLRNRQGV